MVRSRIGLAIGSVAAVGFAFVGLWASSHRPVPHKTVARRPKLFSDFSDVPRPAEADRAYASNPKVAKQKYVEFVAKYAKAKDPVIQDQVGKARVKIGYLAAHQRDWQGARLSFLAADRETKGTAIRGDFGSINEEGAYQAIVCLQASGKIEEARAQYESFIVQRPLSPLCMACYHRLVRLNGGKPTAKLDALIQTATKKQDDRAKFEASVCGPLTIAHLFDTGAIQARSKPHDYEAVARLCHTTDSGTTVQGMVDGLRAYDVPAAAYRVDRQDLAKLRSPAIILWRDHYLTLLAVKDRYIRVYDTAFRSESELAIPAIDDPDFYLNVIVLTPDLALTEKTQ